MCGYVNHDFPQDLRCATSKLSAFIDWITSRDTHMASIPCWCQEIDEIVCMFEKELPTSFMNLQVLVIIHLPYEFELVGAISCCCIFFLERYMKKLKGFV